MIPELLKFSPSLTVLPIVHGSGDFAIEVRRLMLNEHFDCLAVPLPPSFQENVERAIGFLPGVTAVIQPSSSSNPEEPWLDSTEPNESLCSYVPVDPCQGVIAALRIAIQERMPRAFIDLETDVFEPVQTSFPDPYALKKVDLERFAAAMLPSIPRVPQGQPANRVAWMAERLRELEQEFESVLFICSYMDWPWIRESYLLKEETDIESEETYAPEIFSVEPNTLNFFLGEMPFITGLYEKARAELDNDENLSVDGLKYLLLTARDAYRSKLKNRARKITPKLLRTYFQYVRNLALIERRMTPDLYSLVRGAQQIMGDQFAVILTEISRTYPYDALNPFPMIRMGIGEAELPSGVIGSMRNRLPTQAVTWRTCELKPLPPEIKQTEWQQRWDPFRQCSWPPEDVAIENFRTHVRDACLAIMGNDLARTEKFTTSIKDGIDIRDTLRNWHTGDLYVKELPPNRGKVDCVIMLFDSPADPRDYPWRITWQAEHHDESTLALYATNFNEDIVGPGIGLACYGGAMFLFPPRPVGEVWRDPRLNFTDTLEERLIAAACLHSREKHIALLSPAAPGAGWRRLSKKYGKKLVHIPLNRFSQETIQQLRMFHVLNGQHIRSYASHFIRKA